jgi:hypothetical protein
MSVPVLSHLTQPCSVYATHTHEADAIGASTAAAVAARTTRSRVEPLPSDLPDASRETRRELQPLAEHCLEEGLELTTMDAMPLAA